MRLSTLLTAFCLLLGSLHVAVVPAQAAENDPFRDQQWALDVIGASRAHEVATGRGTVIAVIDSGVDLQHQDLAGKFVAGWDFIGDDDNAQDEQGHGTHVAGIAAATSGNGVGVVGVAPGARIMPIRVLDAKGDGKGANVLAGIRWAVDHGATVINLSLARQLQGVIGSGLGDAVKYAWDQGVIVVIAAGNDQFMGSGFSNEPAIVVSSTDRLDRQPGYSNGVSNAKWGMAAPGGDCPGGCQSDNAVVSSWWQSGQRDLYAYVAGTSMAAPHVAGAAAVLRSMGLTPQQTVDRLLSTAVDLGPSGRDQGFGAGRLDLAAAVGAAPRPAASATPAPAPSPSPTPRPSSSPTPRPSASPSPSPTRAPAAAASPSPSGAPGPAAAPSDPIAEPAINVPAAAPILTGADDQDQPAVAPSSPSAASPTEATTDEGDANEPSALARVDDEQPPTAQGRLQLAMATMASREELVTATAAALLTLAAGLWVLAAIVRRRHA